MQIRQGSKCRFKEDVKMELLGVTIPAGTTCTFLGADRSMISLDTPIKTPKGDYTNFNISTQYLELITP